MTDLDAPAVGHSPPNRPDDHFVSGYIGETATTTVAGHETLGVVVWTGERHRAMSECVDCGFTSESVHRFLLEPCADTEVYTCDLCGESHASRGTALQCCADRLGGVQA